MLAQRGGHAIWEGVLEGSEVRSGVGEGPGGPQGETSGGVGKARSWSACSGTLLGWKPRRISERAEDHMGRAARRHNSELVQVFAIFFLGFFIAGLVRMFNATCSSCFFRVMMS